MAPLTLYNILIVLVYATLFWYLYKEEQNTRVIELQRPTDNEEVILKIIDHSASLRNIYSNSGLRLLFDRFFAYRQYKLIE